MPSFATQVSARVRSAVACSSVPFESRFRMASVTLARTGIFRVTDCDGPTGNADGSGGIRREAEEGFGKFGAPCADESREAQDLTGAHFEAHVAHAFHGQHGFADGHLALREDGGEIAPGHEPNEGADVGTGSGAGFDSFAVTQDSDAVGDAAELFQTMRDINDARAAFAQLPDDAEELFGFPFGEGRGGLVQNQDADVAAERFGDLDDLLLGHGERAGESFGMDIGSDGFEQLFGVAAAAGPVDAAQQAAGFINESDIFGDGEVGEDGGLLVNRRDAELSRAMRPVVDESGAIERDGACVRLHGAGEDANERTLPGPVFADDGVHFAGPQVEGDVFEGAHASIAFFDSAGFKQGWCGQLADYTWLVWITLLCLPGVAFSGISD
jgi:hypothetical protein